MYWQDVLKQVIMFVARSSLANYYKRNDYNYNNYTNEYNYKINHNYKRSVFIISLSLTQDHLLRGSGSTVLRATGFVNENH